jgi:putative glycerol-1-phosphate prenyltransferase
MTASSNVLKRIKKLKKDKEKGIAVLIDPDKVTPIHLEILLSNCHGNYPDFFFVGGSFLTDQRVTQVCTYLRSKVDIPLVLFPGDINQITNKADAVLFLSLYSGRNPEYLIGKQVLAAMNVKRSKLEVLPTGYLLFNAGKPTTAQYISNTTPIPNNKPELAACTALAAEMIGSQLIFLDAGSGADQTVSPTCIKAVKKTSSLPVIVGGGINSSEKLIDVLISGADIVVIGNHFESKPDDIGLYVSIVKGFENNKLKTTHKFG